MGRVLVGFLLRDTKECVLRGWVEETHAPRDALSGFLVPEWYGGFGFLLRDLGDRAIDQYGVSMSSSQGPARFQRDRSVSIVPKRHGKCLPV